MFRRFVPLIGLFAAWGIGFLPAPLQAQVNIDQGKSASDLFGSTCATCHKNAKGLAKGRNSVTLSAFLREHYTTSAQQAASLAAYVLGAGPGPAPSANLKPGAVGAGDKAGEAKLGEKTRAGRQEPSATAKLQPPAEQEPKSEAEPAGASAPVANGYSRKPAAGKHEPHSVTASRGPRQEPETPPPAPSEAAPSINTPVATPEPAVPSSGTPVATAPAIGEPGNSPPPAAPAEPALPATASVPGTVPESGPPPVAAAPGANAEASPPASAGVAAEAPEGAPAEAAPVPRDDIPD